MVNQLAIHGSLKTIFPTPKYWKTPREAN